jgi:hypothetical protein
LGPLELPLELELPGGARPVFVQGLTTWTAAGVDVAVVPSSPFGGLRVTRPGPGALQWEVRTTDSRDASASEVIRLRLDLPPGGNLPHVETRLLQVRYLARGGQPVDLVDLIVEPVARGE